MEFSPIDCTIADVVPVGLKEMVTIRCTIGIPPYITDTSFQFLTPVMPSPGVSGRHIVLR